MFGQAEKKTMQIFEHRLCTHVYNPHPNDTTGTVPLPVAKHEEGGYACISSFWRPTAEELAALNRGSVVMLTVLGNGISPMRLQVVPSDEAPR